MDNAQTQKNIMLPLAEIKKNIVRDKVLYMLLFLPLVWYLVFDYTPLFWLQIAFKDYNLFTGVIESPWVGFKHFAEYFSGPFFVRTFCNTLAINVYKLIFTFPLPIILALLYNEMRCKKFVKISQTLVYMPHFISAVVVAGMVINFLSPSGGIVNLIIQAFGGEPVYFLAKPEYFRPIYLSMDVWHTIGFSSIVYIAALSTVDTELYEAATIDGASRLKQLWYITVPGILPTIVIHLILQIGLILSLGYETIILLYQPATYETSDVISTFVYRTGLEAGNYSFAAAVNLFNNIVGVILTIFANRISKKVTDTGIW